MTYRCWPKGTTMTHIVVVSTVLIQASRVTLVAIHENRHFIHASNRTSVHDGKYIVKTVRAESNRCWPRGTTITHVVIVSTVLIQTSAVTQVTIHEKRHFILACRRISATENVCSVSPAREQKRKRQQKKMKSCTEPCGTFLPPCGEPVGPMRDLHKEQQGQVP